MSLRSTVMNVRCKTFDVDCGAELERQFNQWFQAMRDSLDGFVILQSHMTESCDGPLLVVFWGPAPVTQ